MRRTRLNEMSYFLSIDRTPSYSDLIVSFDKQIDLIKRDWPLTKKETGFENLSDKIQNEIETYPRVRKEYNLKTEEEKKDFWKKVKYIEALL